MEETNVEGVVDQPHSVEIAYNAKGLASGNKWKDLNN